MAMTPAELRSSFRKDTKIMSQMSENLEIYIYWLENKFIELEDKLEMCNKLAEARKKDIEELEEENAGLKVQMRALQDAVNELGNENNRMKNFLLEIEAFFSFNKNPKLEDIHKIQGDINLLINTK